MRSCVIFDPAGKSSVISANKPKTFNFTSGRVLAGALPSTLRERVLVHEAEIEHRPLPVLSGEAPAPTEVVRGDAVAAERMHDLGAAVGERPAILDR